MTTDVAQPPPPADSPTFNQWLYRLWLRVKEGGATHSWTPVLTFATPGDLSVSYSVQEGRYTMNGVQIAASWAITTSAFTHSTASGALRISGLPFAAAGSANTVHVGVMSFQGITKASYTQFNAVMIQPNTFMSFNASGSAQTISAVTTTDVPSGGSVVLRGTIIYTTA